MQDVDANFKRRQNLVSLRAALRHGDGVLTRQVHEAVFASYWRSLDEKDAAGATVRQRSSSAAWEAAAARGRLAIDAGRASALVLGVAGAVLLMGETITLAAAVIIAIVPGLVAFVKSLEASATLAALRIDALRVENQNHRVRARRRWLHASDATAALVMRALQQPVALYEVEDFRDRMHFTRRVALDQLLLDDLKDAFTRAENVERIVTRTSSRRFPALAIIVSQGWAPHVVIGRRTLAAVACGAFATTALYVSMNRVMPAFISALVCSAAFILRCVVSEREVGRVRNTITRDGMRLTYPTLVSAIDERIQTGVETLIEQYSVGIDFAHDHFDDIETELRRVLDEQIATVTVPQTNQVVIEIDTDSSAHKNN